MEHAENMAMGAANWLKRLWPLLLLAAVTTLVVAMGWHRYLTLEQLAANRESLRALMDDHYVLALTAFTALYAVTVALSIPGGVVLTVAAGFLFGWFLGGVLSVVGATIGATAVFLVARSALRDVLVEKAGPKLQRFADGFREDATSYLLFLRLIPVFPFWLVNLAPGLLGVSFWTYVLTTFVGIIPGTFAFALAGNGLDSVFDAQQASYESCLAKAGEGGHDSCQFGIDPGALLTTDVIVAVVALGVVALIPVVAKKLSRRTV
ncbi:TVP38/TMEM64 family protein [Methyloceanibacter sp. wino2]|uniref:TVP38/TMEM64 family protein n=1 Tax=Methyloceanibacter sp. wino2 TaxID=2170729 RepID=UPI000D3ECEA6|nr:TVP38/TMEM64 family protein [Methyloceanibacter sp. wino2]